MDYSTMFCQLLDNKEFLIEDCFKLITPSLMNQRK